MIRATSKSINFKALTETQIRFRVEYTKITKKSSNGIRSKHNLRSRLNTKHEVKLINSPKITLNKKQMIQLKSNICNRKTNSEKERLRDLKEEAA